MGGNIHWTIRRSDGTEHRMERWTNVLRPWILNERFIAEDDEYIKESMQLWVEMCDDYARNKSTGNFENNMTLVYAPRSGLLVPSEYGIVITDFKTKTLITHQDYCDLAHGTFLFTKPYHKNAYNKSSEIEMSKFDASEEDLNNLLRISPKVSALYVEKNDNGKYVQKKFDANPREEGFDIYKFVDEAFCFINKDHIEKIKSMDDKQPDFQRKLYFKSKRLISNLTIQVHFPWEEQGWTIYDSMQRYQTKETFELIKSLGFEMSQKEIELWEEHFKEAEEEY